MSETRQTLTGRTTADKIACIEILSSAERGQIITYSQISAAMGRDVTEHRSGLTSARRVLEREGKIFVVVRGVGLRIMEPHEHVADARATVGSVRRKSRRGVLRASHAQTDEMTPEARVEHAAMASVLASVATSTDRKAINRARQDVIDASSQVFIPQIGGAK